MPNLFFILRNLIEGKTLMRIVLDFRLKKEKLNGVVIDFGSGKTQQYTSFIPRADKVEFMSFDQKKGDIIDFESDTLPFSDSTFDMVLFMNVLEHIYNHKHILSEICRVKKSDGRLIGFVPFLKWYHADPKDFFRYTHEALEIILTDTGYKHISIEPLYIGPYSTAFDMILPTIPKILRPLLYTPCYLLDIIFRLLRQSGARRYVLGYYFNAR